MPIRGSISDLLAKHLSVIPNMCMETAEESQDVLHQEIIDRTPVDTGDLRESIEKAPIIQQSSDTYIAAVETSLEYAAAIEYGAAPHLIFPNDAEVLEFNGTFAKMVRHPGNQGYYMFRRASVIFQSSLAEPIAEKNAKKYLGTK